MSEHENPEIRDWIDGWMDKVKHRTDVYIAQGLPKEEAEERAIYDVRMEIRRSPPISLMK